MDQFTPISSTLGGVLIGAAAVLLMLTTGRIAGVSGIISRLLPPHADDQPLERLAFLGGLLAAPLLLMAVEPFRTAAASTGSPVLLVSAGLLVGFGSVLGGGCTSGHGVCGLARLSVRSMTATAVFMLAGLFTVYVSRHLVGG
ncbi:MAG: YeeE/YedE family protein [Hyphomicrobium sp.]|jgi:hypothetical protein